MATSGCVSTPSDDQIFDVAVCQFGAMFFPDRLRGYREAHRVLKPGGKFLFSIWDRFSENVFAAIVAEALVALFPQDPPDFLIRIPYRYFNIESIHEELSKRLHWPALAGHRRRTMLPSPIAREHR